MPITIIDTRDLSNPKSKFGDIEFGEIFTVSNTTFYIKVGNTSGFDLMRKKMFLFMPDEEVIVVEAKLEICKNTLI